MFDCVGSRRVLPEHTASLSSAGGQLIPYNPLLTWQTVRTLKFFGYHRNHRKVMVVDGRVAFTGKRTRNACDSVIVTTRLSIYV
jgi:phosphatidylserine/phosphatidylglycerophosphate/cardiolipin synthase-like enzyme